MRDNILHEDLMCALGIAAIPRLAGCERNPYMDLEDNRRVVCAAIYRNEHLPHA